MLRRSLHTPDFGKHPLLSTSASCPQDKPSWLSINKVPYWSPGCGSGTGITTALSEAPGAKCYVWKLAPVIWKQTPAVHMFDIKHWFLKLSATQEPDKSNNCLSYMEIKQGWKSRGAKCCVQDWRPVLPFLFGDEAQTSCSSPALLALFFSQHRKLWGTVKSCFI